MTHVLFLIHVAATLAMTGIIWFIQLVHYPLLRFVDPASFPAYETAHIRLTVRVAVSLMSLELASGSALLLVRPAGVSGTLVWTGLVLLAVIWLSSLYLQVPQHRILASGFDPAAHRRLVTTNWLRTVAWSLRSALVLRMVTQVIA